MEIVLKTKEINIIGIINNLKSNRIESYKKDHDQKSSDIGTPRHPTRHEPIVLTGDDISNKTFILLLLGNVLYTQHENLIVAEELVQNKPIEATSEALLSIGVQSH